MKLDVFDLTFSYASVPILDHLTFSVEEGDRVAILGPNGTGKSTLLKCIDGILKGQKGSVFFDEEDIKRIPPIRRARRVGYVPQECAFPDSTAVFDGVLLGRKPHFRFEATDIDLKLTSDMLERLGISDLALRHMNELSGGERQKTAIARALVGRPELLLLDEPTSNLDLKNQLEVINLIKEIAEKENLTVIATMHDVNLALRFADKFVFMKDRAVYACGGEDIVTRKMIKEVYDMEAEVDYFHGRKIILPL